MVLQKRLSRVVWFRVSPDEYETMSEFCASSGSRSISDLSRCAVWWFVRLNGDPLQEALANEVQKLRTKIQELNGKLEQLNVLLGSQKEAGHPG